MLELIQRTVWRVACQLPYFRGMGVARRGRKLRPIERSAVLDKHVGEWVAVKDGVVIAHSTSSREVVRLMRQMGPVSKGAVLQRVAEPTDALAVGLG